MSDVSAIILAAGLSRRMGAQNKLLLPVNGVPMIRHMVEIYASISTRIIVVTGHEAGKIETALFGTNVMFAFNPDFTDGQASSVACGLRASGSEGPVLMGLGDQPRLELDDLHTLLEAHMEADPARISIPVAHGKRGNPIVIPAHLRGALLADSRSPGCKTFTRAHPQHVQFHELKAVGFYTDVDNLKEYRAISAEQFEETR